MTEPEFVRVDYDPEDQRIAAEVPDRLFSSAVLHACERMLEHDVSEFGWDSPPRLGFFYQRVRTPVGADQDWHGMLLEWMPLTEATQWLMEAERQHHVILRLAIGLQTLTAEQRLKMLPPDLVAVGLLNEAWMLLPKGDSDAERERMNQISEARKIHEQPDRVEVKMFSGVDLHGIRYGLLRPRVLDRLPRSQWGMVTAPDSKMHMGGEVPDSLHYLILATQGRELPEYDDWQDALNARRGKQ